MDLALTLLIPVAVTVILVIVFGGIAIYRKRWRERFDRVAQPAVAVVQEARQSGTQVATYRRLVVTVEMQAPGHAPWIVQRRIKVPRELDFSNAAGIRIPARFDPTDPRQVDIEWGKRA